jgi:periplasmic copper chaperone A
MHPISIGLVAATIMVTPAVAADTPGSGVGLSRAWTPAVDQTRGDQPIYLTIVNHADAPDTLTRVRCPSELADFTEKHATDRGEGGLAMREVKSFTVPAGATMVLAPEGNHLMLLHVREALQDGQTFTCSLVFQKAGTVPVEVKVAPAGAKEAP